MTDDATTTPQPAHPLPEPRRPDPRFTHGLIFDIAEVLPRNGFPHPAGTDRANLMTALGRFLYPQKETS